MAEKQIISNTGKFSESSSSSNVKSLNNPKINSVTSNVSNQQLKTNEKTTDFMTSSLQFLDKNKMIIIGIIVFGIVIYIGYGYYQENFGKKSNKRIKKYNKNNSEKFEKEQEEFDQEYEQEDFNQEQDFDQEYEEEQEDFDQEQDYDQEYEEEQEQEQEQEQDYDQEYEEEQDQEYEQDE